MLVPGPAQAHLDRLRMLAGRCVACRWIKRCLRIVSCTPRPRVIVQSARTLGLRLRAGATAPLFGPETPGYFWSVPVKRLAYDQLLSRWQLFEALWSIQPEVEIWVELILDKGPHLGLSLEGARITANLPPKSGTLLWQVAHLERRECWLDWGALRPKSSALVGGIEGPICRLSSRGVGARLVWWSPSLACLKALTKSLASVLWRALQKGAVQ